MLNNQTPSLSHMQNTLISTLEELIVVLDTEFQIMQDEKGASEILNLVVNEKQILAQQYADYCKTFHSLPDDMKDDLGAFARDHQDLFEDFSFKLKRNLEVIEARFKRTQMRIQSVFDAVQSTQKQTIAYNSNGGMASNVVPFRNDFSQSVAS